MGRSQELPNQGMEDGGMSDELCCTLGVSRVWSPSDPEPRHVCPAAKCCPDLTSTVYVGSNLSVYELCVPDKADDSHEGLARGNHSMRSLLAIFISVVLP